MTLLSARVLEKIAGLEFLLPGGISMPEAKEMQRQWALREMVTELATWKAKHKNEPIADEAAKKEELFMAREYRLPLFLLAVPRDDVSPRAENTAQ